MRIEETTCNVAPFIALKVLNNPKIVKSSLVLFGLRHHYAVGLGKMFANFNKRTNHCNSKTLYDVGRNIECR